MALTFRKLHPHFVGESSPVELRKAHDEETLARIRAGMDEFAVLVFHDQSFSDAEQIAFGERLDGRLHQRTGSRAFTKSRLGDEARSDISNLDASGEIMKADDCRRHYTLGNRLWHTDASFVDPPGRYSMLPARVVPHVPARHVLGFEFSDEEQEKLKGAIHPLVRTIPRSLRRSLYRASHQSRIIEHATQPEFVYRHAWRVGDLVIWDNRATMHRARPFDDAKYRRELRRVTTLDIEQPAFAAAGS